MNVKWNYVNCCWENQLRCVFNVQAPFESATRGKSNPREKRGDEQCGVWRGWREDERRVATLSSSGFFWLCSSDGGERKKGKISQHFFFFPFLLQLFCLARSLSLLFRLPALARWCGVSSGGRLSRELWKKGRKRCWLCEGWERVGKLMAEFGVLFFFVQCQTKCIFRNTILLRNVIPFPISLWLPPSTFSLSLRL